MSASPDFITGVENDFLTRHRVHRFASARNPIHEGMLEDPETGPALRGWVAAMAERFPGHGVPDETLWEAFDGLPTPVVTSTPASADGLAGESAAGLALVPPLADEEPFDAEAIRRTLGGTAWEKRFINVHCEVFARYSPTHAVAIIKLRRLTSDDGTLCLNPARDAARLGVSMRTLKSWLTPGTGALSFDVHFRTDKAHVVFNSEGEERWICDVRPINFVLETDGNKKVATEDDWFVGVPVNWMFVHPEKTETFDYWTPVPAAVEKKAALKHAEAIWGAAVIKAETRGGFGCVKAAHYLAEDWGKSTGSTQTFLNAAEDAALVVVKNRSGRRTAWRAAQQTPTETPTSSTRRPNEAADK